MVFNSFWYSFFIKILDTKINTREDLEKGLPGLTILGEVPFDENYSLKMMIEELSQNLRV